MPSVLKDVVSRPSLNSNLIFLVWPATLRHTRKWLASKLFLNPSGILEFNYLTILKKCCLVSTITGMNLKITLLELVINMTLRNLPGNNIIIRVHLVMVLWMNLVILLPVQVILLKMFLIWLTIMGIIHV